MPDLESAAGLDLAAPRSRAAAPPLALSAGDAGDRLPPIEDDAAADALATDVVDTDVVGVGRSEKRMFELTIFREITG